jgi:hypothetical protein
MGQMEQDTLLWDMSGDAGYDNRMGPECSWLEGCGFHQVPGEMAGSGLLFTAFIPDRSL